MIYANFQNAEFDTAGLVGSWIYAQHFQLAEIDLSPHYYGLDFKAVFTGLQYPNSQPCGGYVVHFKSFSDYGHTEHSIRVENFGLKEGYEVCEALIPRLLDCQLEKEPVKA